MAQQKSSSNNKDPFHNNNSPNPEQQIQSKILSRISLVQKSFFQQSKQNINRELQSWEGESGPWSKTDRFRIPCNWKSTFTMY